jgi:hypothetical protein
MHRMLVGMVFILAALTAGRAAAQEPRLAGRLPEPARRDVEAVLDSARTTGLPTEPLIDRALEGATKGAPGDRIVAAVRRLATDLAASRDALGTGVSDAEIAAGASALRAGARAEDLARLRDLRSDRPVTVAAAVLTDLVALGVPPDTATAAVLALAARAKDAEYLAFRRNVERDVALGATPVAALEFQMNSGDAALSDATRRSGGSPSPRPRKP